MMNKIIIFCTLHFILCSTCLAANKTINSGQSNSIWNNTLSSGLSAGDTVFMEDGTYNDFQVQFKGNGTMNNPIILKARNYGKVKIEGQIEFLMSGNYLVVDGLHFRNGYAKNSNPNTTADLFCFRTNSTTFANNCRLTNCVFDSLNNPNKSPTNDNQTERWMMIYGKHNRIDHCYFGYKNVGGVMIMNDIRESGSQEGNNLIDHNFFGYRPKYTPGNGAETIRPGDSERSQLSAKCTIRENIFYQCDGEIEVISLKSCDNVVENNLFYESAGQVVCRHGHRNTIVNNVFIGNNKSNTGGVRVINSDHKIYNNFFQDLKGTSSRSALCVMTAFDDEYPLNSYYQVKNVDIAFNTFINCSSIEMATVSSYEGSNGNMLPINTKFWNNIIFNESLTAGYIDKENTSGIDFKGNVFKIKNSATWAKVGFEKKEIDIITDEKGIKHIKSPELGYCMPILFAYKGLDYITTDLTGLFRNNFQEVGAVNIENYKQRYNIPHLNEVGVNWYVYPKPNIE
ncbi:MAG: polysaccharide lyase 6 family protein [Bacteroidales bacterium]|jgi:poly(beta-D-mannuronate) lyase|nr:polysaccharide lyase 6 family protein [Bacteroidales bacterium]